MTSLFLIAAIAAAATAAHGDRGSDGKPAETSEAGEGYAATSVNTTVFRSDPLVTIGDTQFISYYDPEGYLTLGRRTLPDGEWHTEQTQYRGNVTDAHNIISMTVDRDTFLHVSFDHHGHPLRYARSIAPGSLTLGALEPMTGNLEENVTYPEFHSLPDGSLLFAYRSGASGRGNMVLNRYDPDTRAWRRLHSSVIDGEGQRSPYWQICTDRTGAIHLSWVWRESWLVETNHDLCYAVSRDGGLTWQRSDGTPYTLPIVEATAETAWPVPQKSELINQTSMTTDPEGHPMIATYWRTAASTVPQYRLVRHDGTRWHVEQVTERATPFSLSGGGTKMIPIARPRVVASTDSIFFIFRDVERDSRVSMASRAMTGGSPWHVRDLTDYSVGAWEPSIDTRLWRERGILSIFAQASAQGDGERTTTTGPRPVRVITLCPAVPSPVTGRVHPERNDDLAWENDLVAFRAYGPATQRNSERSFGYDIFFKYPGSPVLDTLYAAQCSPANWARVDSLKRVDPEAAREFEQSFTYHIDHGKGMDCFAVGPTLGAGVAALVENDSILFPWCYREVEILENGPDRFRARLTFNPVTIGTDTVIEVREISLEKGSHLNKCTVRYDGLKAPRRIVFGFPRRDDTPYHTDPSGRVLAYTSPVQGEGNGRARLAIVRPDGVGPVSEKENHILGTATYIPGTGFTYWWGYDWDKISPMSEDEWMEYLTTFAEKNKP